MPNRGKTAVAIPCRTGKQQWTHRAVVIGRCCFCARQKGRHCRARGGFRERLNPSILRAIPTEHVITASIPRPIKKAIMLNPTSLLADALGRNLAETYRRIYGEQRSRISRRASTKPPGLSSSALPTATRSIKIANTRPWSPCASKTFCAAVASSEP